MRTPPVSGAISKWPQATTSSSLPSGSQRRTAPVHFVLPWIVCPGRVSVPKGTYAPQRTVSATVPSPLRSSSLRPARVMSRAGTSPTCGTRGSHS